MSKVTRGKNPGLFVQQSRIRCEKLSFLSVSSNYSERFINSFWFLERMKIDPTYNRDDDCDLYRRRKPKPAFEPSADVAYRNSKSVAVDIVTKSGMARVWSPDAEKEDLVLQTIKNLTKYPDIFPYVVILPDYHLNGKSINGAVIPSRRTLYVNAVGGDIGCGMASLKLPLAAEEARPTLRRIYHEIYDAIPCGNRSNSVVEERIAAMPLFGYDSAIMTNSLRKTMLRELGSLGSGNHFIEVQESSDGNLNLMVHSGSRGLGQVVRTVHLRKGKTLEKPRGLVVLDAESAEGQQYLKDADFATTYAKENRLEILRRCVEVFSENFAISSDLSGVIDVPHNYISRENHFGESLYVHRKGAIHVPDGALGIIPGSMGTETYLVRGRGNPYSFESSSHGAGRKMTRAEALDTISPEEFSKAMGNTISRTDNNIFDEAPQAYKDIRQVMRNQRDLVSIIDRLTPLIVIKG